MMMFFNLCPWHGDSSALTRIFTLHHAHILLRVLLCIITQLELNYYHMKVKKTYLVTLKIQYH